MSAWDIQGPTHGTCKSWREVYPELGAQVERISAPRGRGIAWEGTEIWAYKKRPASVAELLAANVARHPDREAYVFHPGGQRLTWGQVGEQVQRVAARLKREHGFVKGDRLCLLTLGCPEYVIGYLAIVSLGGIAVPVNLGLTGEGLAAQINKVGAKGIVVSPDVWHDKLESVRGQFETAKNEFGLDHNESRSWHGWHRHVSMAMLAFAMMAVIRHRANSPPPKKKTERRTTAKTKAATRRH